MTGRERDGKVTARFYMPAEVDEHRKGQDWKYGGLRFAITDTADARLVRHVLDTVRR